MKKIITMLAVAVMAAVSNAMTSEETIASTLWMEARGEGRNGIDAVASVIYNRAKVKDGNAMAAVCLKPKQFSCWNGRKNTVPKKARGAMWDYCKTVASRMVGGSFKPTNNANHYYNPALCNPSWGKSLRGAFVLGNHRFGRL